MPRAQRRAETPEDLGIRRMLYRITEPDFHEKAKQAKFAARTFQALRRIG
jgi:hypothetical protein